jgi:hypothetical protein
VEKPRTLEQAERLCGVWAQTDHAIARIELERDAALAAINQVADQDLVPLVAQRAEIEAALAGWWKRQGHTLTQGKRQSAELGGCVLGTRAGAGKVTITGALDAIIARLRQYRGFARKYLRPKFELDRGAVAKGLAGKDAATLQALGLGFAPGEATFFIKAAGQGGTLGKAQR